MASKSERQPKLKICIDNTEQIDEMEEGEVDDSDEEDIKRDSRHNKSVFSSRNEKSRIELVQQRPLPSPVTSDEEQLKDDLDDLETFGVTKKSKPKVYENPAHSGFELGFDPTSEEAVKKKNERAKRFGISPEEESPQLSEGDLKKMYESLKVSAPGAGFDERGIRFEAIHLRGTDHMSTEDVFKYFQNYLPKSVEWIDDNSCNLIWNDKMAAARAMLGMSDDTHLEMVGKIQQKSSGESTQETNMDTVDEEDNRNTETIINVDRDKDNIPKASGGAEGETEEGVELFEADDDELDLMSSDEEGETKEKPQKKPVSSQPAKAIKPVTNQKPEQMEASDEESDVSDNESSHKRKEKLADSEASKVPTESTVQSSHNATLMKRILPPGNWRLGRPSEKTKFLFMRFATKADKKQLGAERKSQYYRNYGNPNFGGMRGLISASRKRRLKNDHYWKEHKEASEFVRRSQKYYSQPAAPEELSFDEQLRQAKEEKKLRDASDYEDDDVVYGKRRHYNGSDDKGNPSGDDYVDDLSSYWAAAEDNTEFELGRPKKEEEMDMERELGELMKKAPSYRYGRMYADDLEEQITAKRDATQLMTLEVVDDVISIANRHGSGDDHRRRTATKRRHKHDDHARGQHQCYHSHKDDHTPPEVRTELKQSQHERLSVRHKRQAGGKNDLRSQIEKKKEQSSKDRHRRLEGFRSSPREYTEDDDMDSEREIEIDFGLDDDEEGLELLPSESNFKYEKLRIQVDPDDV